MKADDRKAAIRDYRQQKVVAGIYQIRCTATGACWIGAAPNLATIQNRLWFMLGQGQHRDKPLQEAWNAHGAGAFAFSALEEIEDEGSAALRDQALKKKLALWVEKSGGTSLR